jgi:ketosteroid isomerase-like protein
LHDLDSDATGRINRAREVLLSEGIEAYSAMIADSVVCIDHRPMPGGYRIDGHGPFVEAVRGLLEIGVTRIDDEFLAVRGDRLCLSRATHHGTSGVVVVLQVTGLDEDGLLSTVDVFDLDQLDEAVKVLDERYIADEGRAVAATLQVSLGFMRALGERDLAAVEALLADDLVYEDHRPLGFGELDRAAYLASMPPAWESSADIRWLVRRLLGTVGGFSLGSVDVFGTGAGGEFHSPLFGLPTVRDGKIQRLEVFAIEDRAAAEARFAELTAEPDSNSAVEVITRTMGLLLGGRVEEAGQRYGPDMVMEDHRPIIGGVRLEGRDAFEPMASAIVDWGFDRWTWSVVALHGDRLALVRAVFGDGAREVEALLLAEADDQVRYRRLDVFDPDQLELATVLFTERSKGSSSTGDRELMADPET